MRKVIQIADVLKVAVFHFLTRSYATRINVLSDSSDKNYISIRLLCCSGNPLDRSRLAGAKARASLRLRGGIELVCFFRQPLS